MYKNELDCLPVKIRLGAISKKEAAMKVMEAVYTNPFRFNLQTMDEDDRSDFLIDMLPKFENLLERYEPLRSPFGAYLYYSLPGLRKTWSRRKIDNSMGQKAMASSVQDIYDYKNERILRVASPSSIEERFQTLLKEHSMKEEKTKIFQKRSAMVLALKSAWYIDDKQIEKISDFCECPKDVIMDKVQTLRDGLVEKREKHDDLTKKRDRAWYFICKYRDQLSRIDKDSKAYYDNIRKLKYQLNSWKKKNNLIKKSVQRICPDNNTIAKTLNLDPHKISAYINYAKELSKNQETSS